MNLNRIFLSSIPLAFVFLLLLSFNAYADRTVNSITLNGSSNVTVPPSASISAELTVSVSGNGATNRWYSTKWTIGSETACVEHDNHADETANESFIVSTPAAQGTYDAVFTLYGNDGCAGNNTTSVLSDAVLVASMPPTILVNYHFDEPSWTGAASEVRDSSDNNYHATAVNGPLTSADFPAIPGNFGTCAYGVFDGEDDYVALPSIYPDLNQSFTITAWIKTRDNTRSGQRIFIDDARNSQGFGFSLGDGGAGRLRFYSRSTNPVVLDTPNVIANDTWYFVAAVTDVVTKTKRIYVFDASGSTIADVSNGYSNNWGFDPGDASMGGENNASTEVGRRFHFEGNLDEIRVHDGALSETTILALQKQAHFCFGQSAEYRFDLCSETNVILDDSGNGFNGTVLKGSLDIRAGKICNAAYFDGVDDYVVVDDRNAFDGTGALTIAGWINPENIRVSPVGTNARGILSKRDNASSNVAYGIFFYSQRADGKLYVDIDGTNNRFASNAVIAEDSWTHFAVVFDGSLAADQRVNLYLNGNLDTTAFESSTTIPDYNSNLYLGNLYYGTSELKVYQGLLDEIHIIPEVLSASDVVALRDDTRPVCQSCADVDHFEFIHDGQGLTCASETVTLRACANADCSERFSGEVQVELADLGWLPSRLQTLTFPVSGEVPLKLKHTTAETVQLGVVVSTPDAANPTACFVGTAPSCDLVFADAGFLLDVEDGRSCTTLTGSIQAVRKDATTELCTGDDSFSETTRTVGFWFNYSTPDSGTPDVVMGDSALPRGVNLAFNDQAAASFDLSYADAGSLNLYARFEGSGDEAGLVMTGSTASAFVVAPDHFEVTSSLTNVTTTGTPKAAAGDIFTANVQAVCSVGTVTPSFSWPTQLTIVDSQPATAGVLTNGALAAAEFTGGTATPTDLRYSEVGNITLQALAEDYQGSGLNISGTSGIIGRFHPHHFTVEANAPTFVTGCTTFTYLEQPLHYQLAPQLTISARNAAGDVTANYMGNWWHLPDISETYQDSTMPAAVSIDSVLASHAPATTAVNGGAGQVMSTFSGPLSYLRPADGSNVAPFNAQMNLSVVVADGDAKYNSGVAFSLPITFSPPIDNKIRHGRLLLNNAYGSELLDLKMPMVAEYFDQGSFKKNTDDTCTEINPPLVIPDIQPDADTSFSISDICVIDTGKPGDSGIGCEGTGELTKRFSSPPMSGDFSLWFAAPGSGKSGSFTVGADAPDYLKYDWKGNGNVNPTAKATFGIFKGNPHLIYTRESVW